MTKTESAISWMEKMARDNSHGYSQVNRWGPDYDCSSAVISSWQQAGVPVKTKGASYTGNMYNIFKKCGFDDVTKEVNLITGAGLKRGDVLLNRKHHTAMYCGNKKEVEASIDERGTTVGRLSGDQTGKEFLIRSYRNYPWTDVLRYKESASNPVAKTTDAVKFDSSARYGVTFRVNTKTDPLMMRTDATTSAKIVKAIPKNEDVTWYGYYKVDSKGQKWYYVVYKNNKGYCHSEYLK